MIVLENHLLVSKNDIFSFWLPFVLKDNVFRNFSVYHYLKGYFISSAAIGSRNGGGVGGVGGVGGDDIVS